MNVRAAPMCASRTKQRASRIIAESSLLGTNPVSTSASRRSPSAMRCAESTRPSKRTILRLLRCSIKDAIERMRESSRSLRSCESEAWRADDRERRMPSAMFNASISLNSRMAASICQISLSIANLRANTASSSSSPAVLLTSRLPLIFSPLILLPGDNANARGDPGENVGEIGNFPGVEPRESLAEGSLSGSAFTQDCVSSRACLT
mmetsp:Transcript_3165/g.5576  ORF Transcript_3165/g.5576 Transcript_3165/m.5576 type:complete len:207 (-) Transcript_3165:655-1275(-)